MYNKNNFRKMNTLINIYFQRFNNQMRKIKLIILIIIIIIIIINLIKIKPNIRRRKKNSIKMCKMKNLLKMKKGIMFIKQIIFKIEYRICQKKKMSYFRNQWIDNKTTNSKIVISRQMEKFKKKN